MTGPRERPILFSGPMVRAILDGRKTVTRRVMKPQPKPCPRTGLSWKGGVYGIRTSGEPYLATLVDQCPYGKPGNRLYVKETFATDVPGCEPQQGISYRADHVDPRGDGPANPMKWKPSIFMPRWASRILLEVTDVRVERLHDITEEDARAEGLALDGLILAGHARSVFSKLWEEINGQGSWEQNPWVWRVGFKRVQEAA